MIKTVINTFEGGMNKDISTPMLPQNKYRDAKNLRLLTTEGSTTGSMESIKGTKFILDVMESGVDTITSGNTYLVVGGNLIYNGATYTEGSTFTGVGVTTWIGIGNPIDLTNNLVTGYIIGSCQLRDSIILFTTDNTSSTPTLQGSRIYKLKVDLEDESQISLELLYDDTLNVDDSSLNFSTYYPIKAIGKYETPNIQKIYWTDVYNNTRYANVAKPLTVTGSVYSADGDYMSIDKFEFLPKITVTKPRLKNIVAGKIKTGVVAYAYQLYITNGAETAISPLSDPIHVTSDNDFLGNTLDYFGDTDEVNTGKGFVLDITNADSGYNKLRLIRVRYSTLNSTPEICIANEISISSSPSTIEITDVGNTIGELTVDEFNLSSTELFKCEDIASKDNLLFAANIVKSEFICDDWDSRAVRFNSTGTAVLTDSTESPVSITTPSSDTPSEWDDHGWIDYLSDHDGINTFNDPDNDGNVSHQYMYQSNGTVLGAEGKNIKIDFETEEFYIDTSNNPYTYYVTPPDDATDLSYKNYGSPWKLGNLSWQRDETYRIFVVFGNERGQTADPKWICDLRMPSLHDANFVNSSSVTCKPSLLIESPILLTSQKSYKLYPRIYFKSFPTNATWAQIHRVKRERADRSIITQGLALPTYYRSSMNLYHMNLNPGASFEAPVQNSPTLVKLISPEIIINKNISQQSNDYIEHLGNFTVPTTVNSVDNGLWYNRVYKLKTYTPTSFSSDNRTDITNQIIVSPPSDYEDKVTISSKQFINLLDQIIPNTIGCSGLLVDCANDSWTTLSTNYPLVNYKSNVYGSQYSGNTYESRMLNISIPCSDVITVSNIGNWFDIRYGDTFINYFDVSVGTIYLGMDDPDMNGYPSSIYFPVESSINCDLINSPSACHITYSSELAMLRQEVAGSHFRLSHTDLIYDQEKPLYLYNTVYSQELDIKPAISLYLDKQLETEFDSMVKVSNKKSNGEVTDSWTKFGINNFIEVDSIYGPINSLNTFNNRLFYFQDKGLGILSVNERTLISDSNPSQLVLGTGGILDRFDYVSTTMGCKDKFSIANGSSGMFWYDRVNNFIIKYGNQLDKVSVSKGVQSYLQEEVLSKQSVIAHADINNNEILFTFFVGDVDTDTDSFTLSFSEDFDAFMSFYSFIPNIYIPFNGRYLTATRSKYCDSISSLNYLFLHDSNLYPRCNFYSLYPYDPDTYYDSTISLLFNQDYNYTKAWDNLIFNTNVYYNSNDLYDQTLNQIRCYNDYQNTGWTSLTYKTNLERRERSWTTVVPRNLIDANITDDPDIFLSTNLLSTTRTFKERLRDKHMILDVLYTNSATKDKIVISSIGTKYRLSYR